MRLSLLLVVVLALSEARGQESGRYVTIPFQGNFESLFKARLQGATENASLGAMLDLIRGDPAKFGLDPAVLKKLDLENPDLRKMIGSMVAKQTQGSSLTPGDLRGLKATLDKMEPRGQGKLRSLPKEAGDLPLPRPPLDRPVPRPKPRNDPWKRWMRDLAREAEDVEIGPFLRKSPAFQKGMADLKSLVDFERMGGNWDLGNLPAHLRFADRLHIGEGFLDKFKGISLPNMPKIDLPHINLGKWSVPSVPIPNLGRPGGAGVIEMLVWLGVVAAGLVLAWQLLKNIKPAARAARAPAGVGPWPVDPAQVSTRAQLVAAFDYLAVLLLGTTVRTWNHRAIARQLSGVSSQPGAAQELTALYEQARYTHGADALSFEDQSAARRALRLLAGVANP